MAGTALEDPRVVEMATKFVPVLMDRDTETEWVEKHGVVGIPCFQFTDANGDVFATTADVAVEEFADRLLEDAETALEFLSDDEEGM